MRGSQAQTGEEGGRAETSALARFIRRERERILAAWEAEVRARGLAEGMDQPALRDDVPALLERMATTAEALTAGRTPPPVERETALHAWQRMRHGYDLQDLHAEYALLRQGVLRLAPDEPALTPADLALFHELLDDAEGVAMTQYAVTRHRVLMVLDRLAAVALGSESVDALVRDGVGLLREASPHADAAAILLLEGERLQLRAGVGLPRAEPPRFSLALGEGVAGAVAAQRAPRLVTADSADPAFREALRREGLRVCYAVPILHGEELLGVATLASRGNPELPEEDQLVFRLMVDRIALAIDHAQHRERERASHAAARALAACSTWTEAIPALLSALGESFGWEAGGYWQLDARAEVLRLEATWEAPSLHLPVFGELSRRLAFRRGEGLPGRAWRSGRVEWITDVTQDPEFPRAAAAHAEGLRSAIALPLVVEGRMLGVLEFFSRALRSATSDIIQVNAGVARQLGEFLRRVEAQEAVRRSEAHKSAIVELAPDCIVSMDGQGRVAGWNPAAERTFGWTQQEALGAVLADLIIPPHLRDAHHRGLARYLATGEERYLNRRVVLPAVTKDGRELPVELTITNASAGGPPLFTGHLRDISERQRLEEHLRFKASAAELLQAPLDQPGILQTLVRLLVPAQAEWCAVAMREGPESYRDFVAFAHADHAREQQLKPPATALLPLGPGEGLPAVLRTGRPVLGAELTPAQLAALARDASHLRLLEALGTRSLMVVPLAVRGETLGAVTLGRGAGARPFDERDRAVMEDVLGKASLVLENARLLETEQRAVRTRENILGIVSHDLRNPLSVITMSASAISRRFEARGVTDPSSRRNLEAIHRASSRMEHLIRDLLDMAAIQAGRLTMDLAPHDVAELVSEAVQFHEALALDQGVKLRCAGVPDGLLISCDRERILQVLSNVLGNALKFTPAGGLITLAVQAEPGVARFSVTDEGPGIPPENLTRIFDPYWRAEPQRARGVGLGLFISRGIIQGHQGRIWVESRLGQGSTFHFTVPLASP
ncbi:MAG: GAF domain-containing protein [Myxococcota bacterium]